MSEEFTGTRYVTIYSTARHCKLLSSQSQSIMVLLVTIRYDSTTTGMTSVQRQRLVYKAIWEELNGKLRTACIVCVFRCSSLQHQVNHSLAVSLLHPSIYPFVPDIIFRSRPCCGFHHSQDAQGDGALVLPLSLSTYSTYLSTAQLF